MTKRSLGNSVVGRAISCCELPLDAVARTDSDERLTGELTAIVATNRLDVSKISYIRKELLESFCCLGLVLEEVHPGVAGQVVANDQGVVKTTNPRHGLLTAQVHEDSLELASSPRRRSGRNRLAVALSHRTSGTRLKFPGQRHPELFGRIVQQSLMQMPDTYMKIIDVHSVLGGIPWS